jgi:hypothetical protein
MALHANTISTIVSNSHIYSTELLASVNTLIDLAQEHSPLSDTAFLLQKTGKSISIRLPKNDYQWMPIRNVLRIIAQVSKTAHDRILAIRLGNMICGCDYFEGTVEIEYTNGDKISGAYKWQWTAFPDVERSFDKFVLFPSPTVKSINPMM